MSILLLVCLDKSYNTKCRHLLCWCSPNTRGCTSMLWLRSGQCHISSTVNHDVLHCSCICCTVECFVADLFGSHFNPISSEIFVNNISCIWICSDKSYNSVVLPNSGHQVWAAILIWFVNTTDHYTRLTNTIWKIFLIHLYCPIAVWFTSQQVFNNSTDVNRLSQ